MPYPKAASDTHERMFGAIGGVAVTTSDTLEITPGNATNPYAVGYRALWVGGAGNISVLFVDGTTATLSGILAGTLLPICFTRINATGTTATLLVALL